MNSVLLEVKGQVNVTEDGKVFPHTADLITQFFMYFYFSKTECSNVSGGVSVGDLVETLRKTKECRNTDGSSLKKKTELRHTNLM